ncbi:MAG: Uma2 family endonuclease [Spirochaetales bacterium]|nr:Uma2 family endonuclease [Spirochaetales bacterium]
MAIPKETETYTYKDYIHWSEDERWEIISGVPYNMSPAPSRIHQYILFDLSRQIGTFLQDKPCQAYSAPFDVRIPNGKGELDTVVQPDLSIICDKKKLDDQGCVGAPDLIIEILSPATASKDVKEKFNLYEKSGVKEYWIVDPHDKVVFVFNLGENGQYGKPRIFSSSDTIDSHIIRTLVIELESVFTEKEI